MNELILATYPQEMSAIVPLLANVDMAQLNGSAGVNREAAVLCQLQAKNDFEAIYAWLNEYRGSPQTYRTYQREAERLLLWCLLQQHKPLSSLQREDIEAYQEFLVNPLPYEFWCSGKSVSNAKRGEPRWKPFRDGLTESSLKTAVNCIYSLFDYLETAQYLRRNPMKLMRNRVRSSETLEVKALNRQAIIFSPRQWGLLIETMQELPETTYEERREKIRTQLIIGMLYFLGLRISDLVNAKWQDFRVVNDKWWFNVIGKGNKKALQPVATQLLDIIKSYRKFFKLKELPVNGEDISVITSWRGADGIKARHINTILKDLANATLERIKPEHDDEEKFSAFSAHKIRHIMGSDLARAQLSTDARRKLMRHSKMETTLEYSHLSDQELHLAIDKLTI